MAGSEERKARPEWRLVGLGSRDAIHRPVSASERSSSSGPNFKGVRSCGRASKTAWKRARNAVFPISDGDVVLTFPKGISGKGLKRLKRYPDIFLDEDIENAEGG